MKGVIHLNKSEKEPSNYNEVKTEPVASSYPKKQYKHEDTDTTSPRINQNTQITPEEERQKETKTKRHTNLSPTMEEYAEKYLEALEKEKIEPEDPISTDEIASKIASAYERVRRVIDWKEEHLVRRTSIERILKRRLISEISEITIIPDLNPLKIAEPMLMEIIRTGYFKNEEIGEEKILDLQKILGKYLYILKWSPYAKESALAIKTKVHFYNWILSIAACEIDESLKPAYKEKILIEFMAQDIHQNLKVKPENYLHTNEIYLQVYIATHRALFLLDDPLIYYQVIKKKYPEYTETNASFIEQFTKDIESIWKELEHDLNHPKRSEFQKVCEKYDAAYRLLSDVMKKLESKPDKLLKSLEKETLLEDLINESYRERLSTLKARLFRSAIYSTLSIFVAGAASLFFFEYPVAKFFYGEFSPLALAADILIPTGLMFFLVMTIKLPCKENYAILSNEIKTIVYNSEKRLVHKINLKKKIKKLRKGIFNFIYLLGGLGSLYLIYWVFKLAGVPPTSLYIDTVNVALVVFAATIIREKSKELTIKDKTNSWELLMDFFAVPLAKIGSWLSSKWKEYNFVRVFFSILIDTPFSTFIELLEDWREYIKEKRVEL